MDDEGIRLREAKEMLDRGRLTEALILSREIVVSSPSAAASPQAWFIQADCHRVLQQPAEALACHGRVLELEPDNWRAHNGKGTIMKDMGLLQEALGSFSLAIQHSDAREPEPKRNMAIVLTDIGAQLKVAGHAEEARKRLLLAIEHDPTNALAHFNLGVTYCDAGLVEEGLAYYQRAVALDPTHAKALCNIGVIYKNRGDLDNAVLYYQKTLAADPTFVIAINNLVVALTDKGTLVKQAGDAAAGVALYKKALSHNPRYAPAWYNLGVAHLEKKEIDESIIAHTMAVTFEPRCAEAWNNLGVIYKDQGNMEAAIQHYTRALTANPNFAHTLNNLCVVHTMMGQLQQASTYCNRAILADPTYADAYNNLGVLHRDEGAIPQALQAYEQCLACDPLSKTAAQNRLLVLNSLSGPPGPEAEAIAQRVWLEHERWGQTFMQRFSPFTTWPNQRDTRRVLRVGYLSSDLCTHSVSYFIEAPLRFADPSRVRNVCYSSSPRSDARTAMLKGIAHEWRDVQVMDAQQVAALVRRDRIDILVELSGHTAGSRLDVMALRPAPVQVSWIGYPNTTGLPTIDYRITDAQADPIDTPQQHSEELLRLPSTFLCYSPPAGAPGVSDLAASRLGFVTFGSFNSLAKLNDRVVSVWARLLQKVPRSRLLLKCKPFACAGVRAKTLARFERLGVPAQRIDLLPLVPATSQHLALYHRVDIGLDSFPYAGTTTTCEALYMGVPVVTLEASDPPCHAHNVGRSLLSSAAPHLNLVARTEDEYVHRAVALASDLPALARIRKGLRQNMLESELCDGEAFTAGVEGLWRSAWTRWCDKQQHGDDGKQPTAEGAPSFPLAVGCERISPKRGSGQGMLGNMAPQRCRQLSELGGSGGGGCSNMGGVSSNNPSTTSGGESNGSVLGEDTVCNEGLPVPVQKRARTTSGVSSRSSSSNDNREIDSGV